MLLTNSQPGSSYSFRVTVNRQPTASDEEDCKHCLIGTWNLKPESVEPYERDMVYPSIIVSGATGSMQLIFDEEGKYQMNWASMSLYGTTNPSHGGRPSTIEFHGSGPLAGDYLADEGDQGIVRFSNSQASIIYTFILDGQTIGGDAEMSSESLGMGPTDATFKCDAGEMILTPIVPGKSEPGWVFKKVEVEAP